MSSNALDKMKELREEMSFTSEEIERMIRGSKKEVELVTPDGFL